ncbi:MAG: hypothetical protein ABI870_13155 [Rhodanobacter sp.]
MRRWIVLAGWALIAGCATSPHMSMAPSATGDASWRMKESPGTKHYELAMGDVASGANVIERVTPVYPTDQLASCPPPREVEALLIVDKAGKVGEVRVTDEAQADMQRRAFMTAVRAAALQWTFNPLEVEHWAADADGNSHVVDSRTQPFSLTYVFRFECHAGKPSVSADETANRR